MAGDDGGELVEGASFDVEPLDGGVHRAEQGEAREPDGDVVTDSQLLLCCRPNLREGSVRESRLDWNLLEFLTADSPDSTA